MNEEEHMAERAQRLILGGEQLGGMSLPGGAPEVMRHISSHQRGIEAQYAEKDAARANKNSQAKDFLNSFPTDTAAAILIASTLSAAVLRAVLGS